jgi:hypothetical protein
MKRFQVYSGNTLVGSSDLEGQDRSMATAFGTLIAADGYAAIKGAVVALRDSDQRQLDLSIRLGDGAALSCDFIHIADHSDEVAVDGIEVSAHGITASTVDQLFPVV